LNGTLDIEGNMTGTIETRHSGYHGVKQREHADEEKEKYGEHILASGTSRIMISQVELKNTDDISKPFQIKANIDNYPIATVTPDKIYINPVFPEGMDDIPFKLKERTYPIEMTYPEDITMI